MAISLRLRQAHQELAKAEASLHRYRGLDKRRGEAGAAQRRFRASQAQVREWETVRQAYRGHFEALSLIMHPFAIRDSKPQSTDLVQRGLQNEIDSIQVLADHHQLPPRPDIIQKVSKQIPALAALVDFWWQGVDHDLTQRTVSAPWQAWAREVLLPRAYWERQVTRTRCRRKKAKMIEALEPLRVVFDQHPVTQDLSVQELADWEQWANQQARAFQRASSAVEGRNGYLSQLHHNHRGLPKHRYRTWKALYNFDCRAPDGSTPAARFFRREFPDLFETVLLKTGELPQPRRRKDTSELSH